MWVHPELRDDGRVYWTADSDSQLTKGLAALLVLGLSGCTPGELLGLSPDFIALLGLQQALTPSRNNGFLNMFLKMQKATLALAVRLWREGSMQHAVCACMRACVRAFARSNRIGELQLGAVVLTRLCVPGAALAAVAGFA